MTHNKQLNNEQPSNQQLFSTLKTLFLCNLIPDKSGAFERLLMALGEGFRQAGDELILGLAGEPIPAVADSFRRAGLRWSVIPGWTDSRGRPRPWAVVRPALRLIRAERPAAVAFHFGNELPALAISLLAPSAGGGSIRWVWHQQQQIADPRGAARMISRIRLLSFFFTKLVAVYEGGVESFRRRGVAAMKIEWIPNAVPAPEIGRTREAMRQALGLKADDLLAVTIGALIPRKRIDFLLEVWDRLRTEPRRIRLAIVGDGPQREELEGLVRQWGLAEWVRFEGRRQDVADWLNAADLYVHAARAEACAYSILEALAAGLPVVTTPAGAAREQVAEGETGWIREMPDTFAEAVRSLTRDDSLRRRMGKASLARWEAQFTLEKAVEAHRRIYGG